jgi:hypothetical protein
VAGERVLDAGSTKATGMVDDLDDLEMGFGSSRFSASLSCRRVFLRGCEFLV